MKQNKNLTAACTYIQSWLDHLFPIMNVPGMSVAIAHKGKPIFAGAWGVAHNGTNEKLTTEHIFRVASHSKTFTAVLAFLLAEKGVVRLDEPLATYLPWIRKNKKYAKLTLRHILSHGTGTERDGKDPNFWSYDRDFPSAKELQAYYEVEAPVVESNTRFKYSNYGYALAGLVLESATKQTYANLVQAHILKPLGLKSTGPDNPASGKKLCAGHSRLLDGMRVPLDPYLSAGALACVTGFHSTPTELVKAYSAFILKGGLLNEDSRKEFTKPQWSTNDIPNNNCWYCYGLMKDKVGENMLFGHSGGYPGFITKTLVCPQSQLAVSVCFNTLDPNLSVLRGIFDVLKLFMNRGEKNPLVKYEGRFYNLWETADILAGKGKLIVISPTAYSPLEEYSELTPLKGDKFKITKQDGYGSWGETVTCTMKNGKAVGVDFASYKYLSWDDYKKAMEKLKR